ncbi:hypothetical protein DFH08DRAFT_967505 [Mycena albidolilacea]|uniref:SEP domain-containing protein n=1 Tax=Mycena albidolilacea TaxID=1033008 RepID=A0AAD7EJ88_9AGAR|nr:hypothetical protein DFH08DRAFT_967505 [Mycena albidolilacea]
MSGNDDDNQHDEETYFTGGERSGISAQNPGRGRGGGSGVNLVRDLLRKAGGGRDRGSSAGHTLGGEGSASAYVPGAREDVEDELAIRRLTFWRDGFTLEGGPLMCYASTRTSSLSSTPGTPHRPY